jgi:hypothetical protein
MFLRAKLKFILNIQGCVINVPAYESMYVELNKIEGFCSSLYVWILEDMMVKSARVSVS